MNETIVIGIDHGNSQIKTLNCVFPSGIIDHGVVDPGRDNILEFEGRYYSAAMDHASLERDKTVSDRYYLLNLIAIAKELNAAAGYTLGQAFDITISKKWSEETEWKAVTETAVPVTLTVVIPEALRKDGRTYGVVRDHNEKAALVESTCDTTANTITFRSDKFSTYAIVYKDATSNSSAKTGITADNSSVMLAGVFCLLSVAAIFCYRRRSRGRK